jgi:hypothetical protein
MSVINASGVQAINPLSIIAGSLAFVGGLAWNNSIQAGIDEWYPAGTEKSLQAKFIYALIVTFIIVLLALFIKYVNDAAMKLKTVAQNYEKTKVLSGQYSK